MDDERFEERTIERVVAFVVVLVLPLVSFPLGDALGPDWQTGNITDRAVLHLDPEVTIFFAPFVVVAWLAVLASIATESFMVERRSTRWLVYSSVPLTLHFLVVSGIAFVGIPVVLGAVIVGLWAGSIALVRRQPDRSLLWIGSGIAVLGSLSVIASVAINGLSPSSLLRPLAIPLLLLVLGGPAICFGVAVHRSLRLRRRASMGQAPSSIDTAMSSIGALGWISAYALAWRQAANKAAELYEELPVEQPTCWIATAAATGHPRVVRSSVSFTSDGAAFAVTRQLQTLKLAELVIAAIVPNAHRRLRSTYDRWGRRLAGTLSTAHRADLAFLALKPAEWLGRLVTAVALDDADARRQRMYRRRVRVGIR